MIRIRTTNKLGDKERGSVWADPDGVTYRYNWTNHYWMVDLYGGAQKSLYADDLIYGPYTEVTQ